MTLQPGTPSEGTQASQPGIIERLAAVDRSGTDYAGTVELAIAAELAHAIEPVIRDFSGRNLLVLTHAEKSEFGQAISDSVRQFDVLTEHALFNAESRDGEHALRHTAFAMAAINDWMRECEPGEGMSQRDVAHVSTACAEALSSFGVLNQQHYLSTQRIAALPE